MSDAPTTPQSKTDPIVVVHKWPWTTEEFVSMGVVFSALAIGAYFAHSLIWSPILGVLAVASIPWLMRVKSSRVNRSAVTITIKPDNLTVDSKGALGKSAVNPQQVETIGYRKFNSDECFMLSGDDRGARVPVRATTNADVRKVVDDAFARAVNISDEARDLYGRTPAVGAKKIA